MTLYFHFDANSGILHTFDTAQNRIESFTMQESGTPERLVVSGDFGGSPGPEEKPQKRAYKKRTTKKVAKPVKTKHPVKHPRKKPQTQEEIDAFVATLKELGSAATAKHYRVTPMTVSNWKYSFVADEGMSATHATKESSNEPNLFKCPVDCGQTNWHSRQEFGQARCPKCFTKAIIV